MMKNLISDVVSSSQKVISTVESMSDYRDGHMQYEMVAMHRQKLTIINYIGMLYIISLSVLLLFITNYLTLPFAFEMEFMTSDGLFYCKALSWFLFTNFFANYALVLRGAVQSIYCSPRDLPMYNARCYDNWSKCRRCDRQVPLRTRHCNICDKCILKRDHHCYFTGCCIGFHNQRYFICLCFYGLIGALYAIYFLHKYLSSSYVSLFSIEFYKYFLPYAVVTWLCGYQDFVTILLLVLFCMNFMGCVGGTYFVLWQCNLVLGGQTSYEFIKGDKTYQSNVWNHLRCIFGPYWILNFLFPMPFLKSEADGISWETVSTKFM